MKRVAQLLLPLLFVCSVFARDGVRPPVTGEARTSEFDPEKEGDTLFVVDDGSGLDTGCSYRTDGPLEIRLRIRRYVGPVNPDGTLQNPEALIDEGVLSETAHLRMPVYDVDSDGDPGDPAVPPELDIIAFNGEKIGELSGENNRWKHNEFTIPIRLLKFPALGAPPVDNVIRIDIDQASGTEENWCTAVDWAELQFDAVAPVFFVHGINSNGAEWQQQFLDAFKSHSIPYSNAINLPPFGTIVGNGRVLAQRLHAEAERFGARECHIIAHSKGGLDTRAFLNDDYDEERLKVRSFYTLGTPHRGTPVADFGILVGTALFNNSPIWELLRDLMPGFDDLTTWSVSRFNASHHNIPSGIQLRSFGSDADLNRDGSISGNEAEPYPRLFAAFTYQLIGHGERVVVITVTPGDWGTFTFPSIDISVTPFVVNDTLVSELSANFGTYISTLPANHSTMKSRILGEVIVDRIKHSASAQTVVTESTPVVEDTDQQFVAPTSLIRDSFQLTPSSRTRTFNVTVDSTPSVTFFTIAPSRTLTVTATAPGGATFACERVPLQNGNTIGGGYFATVANPIPGVWTITVAEAATLAKPLDVVSTVQIANTVQSVLVGGGDHYPLGGKIRLAMVVFDGTRRLTGVTIASLLLDPSVANLGPQPIVFRDDGTDADTKAGDGVYEAFVTPPSTGEFSVRVEATGTASTGAFRRSAATTLRVVARDAQITDVDDFGRDDDFDGLYDRILISPYATLNTAGAYRVFARLRASNGREMQRTVELTLPAGGVRADISFAADALRRDLGVDGPYTIAEVRFSHIIDGEPVPADIRFNVGVTAAYDLDDLQHRLISLSGTGSAQGINTDNDSDFEQLEVKVGVLVEVTATYTWSVTLRDRNGREISFIAGQQRLNRGTNDLRLLFPADAISRHGINGPYLVTNLAIYGAGESLVVNNVFTTQAFKVADFGPAPRRRATRH